MENRGLSSKANLYKRMQRSTFPLQYCKRKFQHRNEKNKQKTIQTKISFRRSVIRKKFAQILEWNQSENKNVIIANYIYASGHLQMYICETMHIPIFALSSSFETKIVNARKSKRMRAANVAEGAKMKSNDTNKRRLIRITIGENTTAARSQQLHHRLQTRIWNAKAQPWRLKKVVFKSKGAQPEPPNPLKVRRFSAFRRSPNA